MSCVVVKKNDKNNHVDGHVRSSIILKKNHHLNKFNTNCAAAVFYFF
jgi:hypothetical protein